MAYREIFLFPSNLILDLDLEQIRSFGSGDLFYGISAQREESEISPPPRPSVRIAR